MRDRGPGGVIPRRVTLWQGRSEDRADTLAADAALLAPDELERLRRLRTPLAARRYAAAHAAVRRRLGAVLDVDPVRVPLGRGPCPVCGERRHGPPVVRMPADGPALSYSLSRSGPHWMLAVAPGHPVGVDLERERPLDVDAVARAAFSARERRAVAGAGGRALAFRCWTRKEAVAKATGHGIAMDLRAVETRPRDPGPVRVAAGWQVYSLFPGGSLHAAVAVPEGEPGPVCRW
ncbi:4'-phosphopantetheinyl transferase family protein [Streptomyces xanthophaeus]|uniref:4'-phosphopantetheinyl transferase family protein n=1 Tax=Streptomyces xanthophaeus TaxID=67385 RepID=UPI0026476762|nr:4'-phosphopantetheinyl transferase superfamily protein [Streptomyces xanthophaeus]WKD32282.1 4'-phosphopantetheinyl transferase superfamily protein [Streptomyces xanthophaeus]